VLPLQARNVALSLDDPLPPVISLRWSTACVRKRNQPLERAVFGRSRDLGTRLFRALANFHVTPLIRGYAARQANLQIVSGQRLGPVFSCAIKRQRLHSTACLRSSKSRRFSLRDCSQGAGTLSNRRRCHPRAKTRSSRPGPLRKRKNVQVCERKIFDQFHGCSEILIRLAGESYNNIRTDARMRQLLANQSNPLCVVLGAVPAIHRLQDLVRTGLQRQVKVGRNAVRRSDQVNEILGDVLRLNRAQAQPLETCLTKDSFYQ